jgi:hypothetical protein
MKIVSPCSPGDAVVFEPKYPASACHIVLGIRARLFQARLHRHIRGRCSLESRTLRHQRGSFESPTYFSLFYKGSREVIVSRITFASSTSETIEIRYQKWGRSSFISGFCLLNPSNSAPSLASESVTLTTGVGLLTDTQRN